MKKAIAVEAVFLIGVISIFIFFVVNIFFKWIDTTNMAVNEGTCTSKRISFCADWARQCAGKDSCTTSPDWWSTKAPTGCEKYNIPQPDCKTCQDVTQNLFKCG